MRSCWRSRWVCTAPVARIIGMAARSGPERLVGQDDMRGAAAHRILRLAADRLDRIAQRVVAAVGVEGAVDLRRALAHIGAHGLELGRQQHRALQLEQPALALILVQHIAQIAEPRLQAHHPLLAQGVDRRVGDLAEILPEEMMQAAILVGRARPAACRRPWSRRPPWPPPPWDGGSASRSSMVKPAASWRRRSSSLAKIAGSPGASAHQAVDDGDVLRPSR